MKKLVGFAILVSFLLLAGCTTTTPNESVSYRTVRQSDIHGSGVIHLPVVADLDVGQNKVEGIASGTLQDSVANLRNQALAHALETSGADILVHPTFFVKETGTVREVRVEGYPASYGNFRQIQSTDLPLLNIGETSLVPVTTGMTITQSAAGISEGSQFPVTRWIIVGSGIALGLLLLSAL